MIASRVPTALFGFTQDAGSDPSLGNWLSQALKTELMKKKGMKFPAAEEIEKTRLQLNIGRNDMRDPVKAALVARSLDCRQFFLGSITSLEGGNKINIQYGLYSADPVNALFQDEITVNTGIGIYDALDKAKAEVVKKLFERNSGSQVTLRAETVKAGVWIDGKYIGTVGGGSVKVLDMVPNRKIRVDFREPESGLPLLSTNLVLGPDEEAELVYQPKARLTVMGLPGAQIISPLEGIIIISSNGFVMTEVPAMRPFKIGIRTREKFYEYEMEFPDGAEGRIGVENVTDPSAIDYRKSFPLINFMLPGFAQFQANDPLLGTVFAVFAAGGMALTGLGIYQKNVTDNYYNLSVLDSDRVKYREYGQFWGLMTVSGAGFWALAALTSAVYAWVHPSRLIDIRLPEKPLKVSLSASGLGISYAF